MSDRNNEQRLAEVESASVPISESKDLKTDILSFLTPTHFVDLPSKGRFYPPGHPLKDKHNVEIRFMTAKEEDILTSKSLLKKGIAIDRMLESLIVDKSINIQELLVGDKNALVVGARATGYGTDYETKVQCPSCGASMKHTFDLTLAKEKEVPEEFSKQLEQNGFFTLKLPISKLEVGVRLLKGADEKLIIKSAEDRKNSSKVIEDSVVTDQLKMILISVNGVKDKDILNKFIQVCPAGDARFIRNTYNEVSPDLDLTQKIVCRSCDAESEMEVPFTVDFFWSGR